LGCGVDDDNDDGGDDLSDYLDISQVLNGSV
jgi:hypothetical protein